MKICYLAPNDSIHTHKWINFFANNGHEVHLICLRYPGADNMPQIKTHLLKLTRSAGGKEFSSSIRRVNLPWVIIQTKNIINKVKPDLIHAHYVSAYGFIGALMGFHPFMMTAWGSDILIEPQNSKLLNWATKFALKKADLITCDADHLIEVMIQLGASREKIKLIQFGIDTRRFQPKLKDEALQDKLQISPGTPTVISLRSLTRIYDLESLIKAAPWVLSEVPSTKFIIVGDGEQRIYLQELATSLGIASSVKFVGRIPNHELSSYLNLANVYVSTSLSDAGLASSTAEAMACELPVVITDFGNNSNWVTDGQGGFLVPLQSPAILAEKIVLLLKDEDTRKKFGRVNRAVIEEKNDYYREMEKVESIYQILINRGKL